MTTNWAYVGCQALAALLSLTVALPLLLAARARRAPRRTPSWVRLLIELPALALVAGAAGALLAPWLPGPVIPWTVVVAFAFYWIVLWWPLRVLWCAPSLRRNAAGRAVLATAGLGVAITLWALFGEPQWLQVERIALHLPDVRGTPIRIAHITDLQLIDHNARDEALVLAVNAFDPHLVVFTGDYVAGCVDDDTAIEAARWVIRRLHPRYGIYATISDSDDEAERQRVFDGLGVTELRNADATLQVEGTPVRIGGLDHFEPDWHALARGAADDELFVIACHWPDHAEETARRLPGADLYLCGHTHGGQVQVPGLGPLLTFSDVPRHVAAGGLFHTGDGMPYVVGRGLGMEGSYAPRFRLDCRPQVVLLTLLRGGADARVAAR